MYLSLSQRLQNQRHRKDLGAEITKLCGYLYAAEYRLLTLIREFDKANGWHEEGLYSCAHWLNWQCGIGMNAAREKVRVAHCLADLPKISAALEKGEISYSKVRAMTRVANSENEVFLLMIARHGTASHMERLIAKTRWVKRLQDAQNANQQHEHREVTFAYDEDGALVIRARLPAEQGALVLKALEMAMDRAKAERKEPAVSAETCNDPNPKARVPFSVHRADAMIELAETYLSHGAKTSATADRYQVVVHVSAETLKDGSGEICELEHGPNVSAETSRRIACDSSVVKLFEDETGEPINIGRKSRVIPPAMRRILKARDKGCRFPGCTHQYFIDGHHIKHWAAGGETSINNLVQLCRYHHRLVHEGGFGCEKTADGRIVFKNKDGKAIHRAEYHPPIPPNTDAVDLLRQEIPGIEIDAKTCVTRWEGEKMDYSVAVEALMK
ncbi:MAG: DUF222 domain-containing protein [Proteobacteria bacterium]|nr:DUF222 domain-containing protein [Pseudomonadota bacterium]